MRQIGFDGYLIDLLNYPEGMAYWLKGALNLHRIVRPTVLHPPLFALSPFFRPFLPQEEPMSQKPWHNTADLAAGCSSTVPLKRKTRTPHALAFLK
jgi:hypothetical protein